MPNLAQLKNAICKFHNNEAGMETLQVVLIIALAAIAGVAVYQFGSQAKEWCQERLKEIFRKTNYQVPDTAASGAEDNVCYPDT